MSLRIASLLLAFTLSLGGLFSLSTSTLSVTGGSTGILSITLTPTGVGAITGTLNVDFGGGQLFTIVDDGDSHRAAAAG